MLDGIVMDNKPRGGEAPTVHALCRNCERLPGRATSARRLRQLLAESRARDRNHPATHRSLQRRGRGMGMGGAHTELSGMNEYLAQLF
jgi:hypothetical protein